MTTEPIRYLDVCAGYSAVTLAWDGLPFRCVGYSEIEPFPRAILEQRHGAVAVDWDHRFTEGSNVTPLFGDFTKIEAHHVGPVDLLAGGTPCQAFSVAGKRLGLDDPRGNLTLEFLALARRLRAPWILWENVPGFLSHDGGRTMGTFLRLLGECGYGWAYRVLDAQYVRVDGHLGAVPQRRRRLFVVGHLGDEAGPAAVLFERESLRGDPAPRREAGQGIARPLGAGSPRGSGYRNDADTAENLVPVGFGGGNTAGPIDAAACLVAGRKGDFEVETFVAHALREEGFDASEDGTGRGTPIIAEPIVMMERGRDGDRVLETRQDGTANAILTPNGGRGGLGVGAVCIHSDGVNRSGIASDGVKHPAFGLADDGAAFSLTTGSPHVVAHGFDARQSEVLQYGDIAGPLDTDGHSQAIAFDTTQITNPNCRSNPQPDGPCHTIAAGAHPPALATPWAVRRLTPTECERLMGVADDFTAISYRGKPAADGPRYKVLGNSQARNQQRFNGHGLAMVIAAQREAGIGA